MPDLTRKIKNIAKKKQNPKCPTISPEKQEQGYYCDGKGFIRLDIIKNQQYKLKLKQKEKFKKQSMQPRKQMKRR